MGTSGLERFLNQHRAVAREALSTDPFFCAVAMVGGVVVGSSAQLLDRFAQVRTPAGWPSSPRALTQHLRQLTAVLRKAGWEVYEDGGRNRDGITVWTLRPPGSEREGPASDPQSPQTRSPPTRDGFAGFAGQETPQSPDGRPEYRL
jgi:hypothetical protein